VVVFQYSARILLDGIAGPVTIRAYNEAIEKAAKRCGRVDLHGFKIPLVYDLSESIPPPEFDRYPFKSLRIDPSPVGYTSKPQITVHDDVYQDLCGLYRAVHELGGIINLDTNGCKRALATTSSPYRSRTSFHYLGRAFDLHSYGGLQKPESDPFVITKDPENPGRRWIVWGRSSKYLPPKVLMAQKVVYQFNRRGKSYTQLSEHKVEGSFFNFTELAARFGFRSVPIRRAFLMGNSLSTADWWHFQWERNLVWGETTFGDELLKCYPMYRILRGFPFWDEVRNFRWGREWI
jgi:hypothetical protein